MVVAVYSPSCEQRVKIKHYDATKTTEDSKYISIAMTLYDRKEKIF